MRPVVTATYEPYKDVAALAASLSYAIIKNHPFLDGNKRTAFFIANEYVRAHGLPGLADEGKVGKAYEGLRDSAEHQIGVATKWDLGAQDLSQ